MLGQKIGNKNLKDIEYNFGITIKDSSLAISYTKTNKLITALYMVTDILDKEEPLRNKLRTLGTEIISDTNTVPINALSKINQIMSFLDIASAINIISAMNSGILKKEFSELNQAIKDSTDKVEIQNREVNLSEFFEDPYPTPPLLSGGTKEGIRQRNPKEHTRIGVQKGSTLMKALNNVQNLKNMSNSNSVLTNNSYSLKNQRRNSIKDIIKSIGQSSTIKDIKDKIQASPDQAGVLLSCGEKTLQRELISMLQDGILSKTGEKRWSKYFLKPV